MEDRFTHTDETYWQAIRLGDKAALEALATRHYRPLFHYCTRFTVNHALIEDCIQDLFLAIWEKKQALTDVTSVKAYLFTAIRHNILHRNRRDQLFTTFDESGESADPVFNPESLFLASEDEQVQNDLLKQSLDRLPRRQREAIYLRYYEELSYEEIASVMGLNRQVVANYLQHALLTLRKYCRNVLLGGLIGLVAAWWFQ
ncbi:sigma-70 family RNA polymerase sigma factor [Larkinella knui]|uniref:Sigma-70 family RNA polymerase sigma factor n=1 Tax=Larkinella knui TaxID=2025310 RepID=A0A3P1CHH2_9BACT|nr:sigma-70 family RNA polymerase sigma factor [Larkinella knui]RRB12801.1 sigma-70 family RNA polymerase sigma factor [Larkinella knui]